MASIKKRTIRWRTSSGAERTGVRYQARYRDRGGKEHARLFQRKREAQDWLDAQSAGLITGQWADPRAGKETLKAYAERWRQRQIHAPSTESSIRTALTVHIYPVLGATRLDQITRDDVQMLVKTWSQSAAATTVKNRYLVLAMVLRAAVRDRVIPLSPCEDIKLPKLDSKSALVPISTATVLALCDAMPERYRLFVTLGAGTGMRRGELLGLTEDRISLDFGTIRVDRQLDRDATGDNVAFTRPKTQASVRTIPVADVVLEAVKEHIEKFGIHETGLLFTSEYGAPVRTSTLWTVWKNAATAVGTDATPHDLRHYFASIHISGGTSIKALQSMLGHKSASETWDTYGHLMGDEDDRSRTVIQNALGSVSTGDEPSALR